MGLLHSIMGLLFSKCAPYAERGFAEDFDPPLKDGLKCCVCHHGLRNPKQTHCGHRFCEGCINESIRNKGRKCPVSGCEQPLGNSEPYPDNFANREILTSNVHCKLKRTYGCPWKGPLQDLEYHLKTTCLFVSVKCDCGCEIPRGDLQRHILTGCPRTMDWRLEAIVDEHIAEEEIRPLPFPVKEMDSSSSPGQITGIRRPVEHHQGSYNMKQLREAGNEFKQLDSPVKLKEPLPYQSKVGKKGKKGHGVNSPPEPKNPPAHQKEDSNEVNRFDPPGQPKDLLAHQMEDGNKAILLVGRTEPKEPLACQKKNGNEVNGLDPPAELEDSNKAIALDPPPEVKGPLMQKQEDGNEVNESDHPAEPRASLVHQMETGNEATAQDPPAEPEELSMYQKEDGNEVNGLDPSAELEDSNKAIALDPPPEVKEPLMYKKEDGNEVNGLDPSAELEDSNKAIALDLPPEVKEPLMYKKEGGNEVNGLDHPAEPRASLVHQMETGYEATAQDPPAEPEELSMYQKEDGNEVNGLDHPTEPKESSVQPKEPDPAVHGCEANRFNLSAKPTKPSPCQGEDANHLDVSSQNHVPSFI